MSTGWPNGAKAAVALSYDDALPCHPRLVAPALEQHGLRGTFYVPIGPGRDVIANPDAWRALAARGHELGNHTLFHPCRREAPVPEDRTKLWNNLIHFDAARLRAELQVANFVLHLLDGKTERTYGNTCHNITIGPPERPQRIEPILREMFVAARGECTNRPTNPANADLMNLGTTGGDGRKFSDWRTHIELAIADGSFVLFTFHGVGAGYQQLQVDAVEHEQLLQYLHDNRGQVWTAPVIELARWIRQQTT